jgi:hypothetical protein
VPEKCVPRNNTDKPTRIQDFICMSLLLKPLQLEITLCCVELPIKITDEEGAIDE